MKRFTILMAMAIFSIFVFAQQAQYSKVKVFANEIQIAELANVGIDVTEGFLKKGSFLVSDFSQKELLKIQELGLNYEILFEDVSKFYADRNIGKSTNVNDYKGTSEWEIPENFEFGSMGGHATYDEIAAHLDNMATLFPDLITIKESIGQSIEEKEMWMVKISDNPAVNETEPEVLYTALHHAREPAGVMSLLYYMYYLLENYDSDPLIQILVDNTEMYFVPVVNPDGYVHNQTIAPNGGGMWRKNRKDNGVPGCMGVDLNRNYGYMWGYDNNGSSPDPCEETYRGEEAFSEPETQNMKTFCEDHEFVNALNYHTYSNLLLYAWGYTEELCPDDDIYYAHATLMTQDNNYTYGAGSTTIYPTNGGSDDWMYGEQDTKNKIFAYTPELGGSDDGFWCSIDRIVPIAQENMIQNILAAAFAGAYTIIEETSPTLTNINEGYLTYDINRLGLMEGSSYKVSIEPISDIILSTGNPKETSMAILETISDSISYTLPPFVPSGTQFHFLLSIDNGDYILSDTLSKMFGEAIILMEDDCNDISTWITPVWDVTTNTFNSPTGSITDSPSGNYPNNHTSTVLFDTEVDLSDVSFAMLNFWAKWEIEEGWDYVQVEISTDNGVSWTPLAGKYTVTGNGYQAEGEPVYDGFQTEWVEEEVDLSEYIGNMVTFRFRLKTDQGVTEDGFYFDDFAVKVVEFATTGLNNDMVDLSLIYVSNPIPNPANGQVQFNLSTLETENEINFIIYNSTGQVMHSSQISSNTSVLNIDVNHWNPGIYYYKLQGEGKESETKKLVIIR